MLDNGTTQSVTLKANESTTIFAIPIGTGYTVTETNLPSYWSVVGDSEKTGTIASGTNEVTFTNTYSAEGSLALEAHKRFEGELEAGKFSFALYAGDAEEPLQTVRNGAVDEFETIFDDDYNEVPNPWYGTAPVVFDELEYTTADIGTHTYRIREIAGTDLSVDYDGHEETVTVTVSDAGNGRLNVNVVYDSDGA